LGYHDRMSTAHGFLAGLAGLSLLLVSCGGTEPAADAAEPAAAQGSGDPARVTGISTISVDDAAALTDDPPSDLVVLDVRTPEEFAEGHLDGAVLVDFYDADFAEQLAALDPDVPYLMYCRSGNRSGQALGVMEQLGFSSVADVGGGILAWTAAGLPVSAD
jgi:phage shock protein E